MENTTKPSPKRVNPPVESPSRFITITPIKPIMQPKIFLKFSLSDVKKIGEISTPINEPREVITEVFVPVVLESPM